MEGQEVDWRQLVHYALLGSSDLEQYAILLVRVSLGLFFAISGANKLFVADSTQTMYKTSAEGRRLARLCYVTRQLGRATYYYAR